MIGVTQIGQPKRVVSLALSAALVALIALTGCKEEPVSAPPPPSVPAGSNADLFAPSKKPAAQAQPQSQPAAVPSAKSNPTGPGAASSLPSLIPGLDPALQKECQALKTKEKSLRTDADVYRNKEVAPAASSAEVAYEAFAKCQMNVNCTNSETQYARLGKAVNQTQATMERLEEKLMIMEGELHDVSQKISRNCGDF